ncbi:metallophosphoesterase [Bradyrhizobium canariense]|uniref:Metallophosphoesterase n=1 Tax=Bradyrhizobium canariense TaxID=255045 RepID=A0A1X3HCH9_9BRAD|nr:metallophosphoesterase [Bradyrhizobium canariense]OSI73310.1 metallophosphoesterase [Bradyrhizobium canariense]OSI79067.1 metallophosphoesterase [Bradyrhizobium canariense]OSI90024.1 metallophosphoesterase [Bradyrhizobium canariense]OSI92743.1 metallophosphoesterase [Bradyrhizobium canariense]OSJ08257.1 metallophosphoesterase [Bradyrhizobium canariense]
MLLWILSDLHLEATRGWDLPSGDARPDFDVMIVAGDLIPRAERGVRWLLERVPDRPVLYIMGNHEGYGTDLDVTLRKARKEAAGTSLRVLQDECEMIGDVLFLGATLWTDFELFGNRSYAMNRAADVMNDYRRIRKKSYAERLRPADTVARHFVSREFFARKIREIPARRKVVISHHGCVRECVRIGSEQDVISAAYTSDCRELLDGVDLWIYGHTHESRDFRMGIAPTMSGTRIVSNAKGYGPWAANDRIWENREFDPNFVVEIE